MHDAGSFSEPQLFIGVKFAVGMGKRIMDNTLLLELSGLLSLT